MDLSYLEELIEFAKLHGLKKLTYKEKDYEVSFELDGMFKFPMSTAPAPKHPNDPNQ